MSEHLSKDALLNHPTIGERYFFPRTTAVRDPFVVTSGGQSLRCYLRVATPDAPMLVHFHGNGEVVADWADEWPDELSSCGVSTMFGEYRGYGGSGGTPQLGAMLADAVRIAQAADVPPERMVAYGRSVGSIFAIHAASELGLAGLILESGIADVGERLLLRMRPGELGATPEALDAAISGSLDHRRKLADFGGPVLVFHAEGDDLVPIDNADRLALWAGDRATLTRFDRGDHNTIHAYNGAVILEKTAAFVKDCTDERAV